jgi:hypothetical protein
MSPLEASTHPLAIVAIIFAAIWLAVFVGHRWECGGADGVSARPLYLGIKKH